uniref:(northern house mosquito) hypothetical protein n=1 Tax=Culex pipiens TaxID=7175 RepID=A0A8D7ZT43_CULPI
MLGELHHFQLCLRRSHKHHLHNLARLVLLGCLQSVETLFQAQQRKLDHGCRRHSGMRRTRARCHVRRYLPAGRSPVYDSHNCTICHRWPVHHRGEWYPQSELVICCWHR